jgi:curved DNA-binding protein CbpA
VAAVQPDHYLALGITPDASRAEVRAAYLRVMRETHPDRNPGDPVAEEAARAANAAWAILGDAAKRGAYDRLRTPRADGGYDVAVTVVRSEADEARLAAYRQTTRSVSRQYTVASVKLAGGLFLVGLLLLLAALR